MLSQLIKVVKPLSGVHHNNKPKPLPAGCISDKSNNARSALENTGYLLGWKAIPGMNPPVQMPFTSSCCPIPHAAHSPFCHVIYAPLTAQPRPGGRVPIHLTAPICLPCLVPHEHSAAVTN